MNRRIAKALSALLLALAIAVTRIPVADVEAQAIPSDFQTEGDKLLRYAGTAEVVSVPAGIKKIGEEAFAGNDNLIKVNIGNEVEAIGYGAFSDCGSLRTVEVGDTVTTIDSAAFSNNRSLKNVKLGAGVSTLGSGVFAGSGNLTELTVAEENPYLYYSGGVLYDDEQKVIYTLMPGYEKEAFTVPSTVEEIKAYAFWGNPYLAHVKLDSSLLHIPPYAFSGCMNLKEVSIPLPVRSIEAKAFEDCVNLKSVTLPESVAQIHDTAFDGCANVEFTTVPGTYGAEFAAARKASEADRIEYEEVQDSQVISPQETEETKSPALPPEINTVSGSYSSEKLLGESSIVAGRAVIFIDNARSEIMTGNDGNGRIDLEKTIGSMEQDEGAGEGEKIFNLLSENAEKGKDFPKYTVVGNRIASQAYYQDNALTEYEIGAGITEIGEFAFARTGLESVVIPEGVEKIGYGAFYHCDKLREVVIPDSVREIEANAFAKTPWLDGANQVYTIAGDGILLAYKGSESIVNIPRGVRQIGAEVFKDHMGITAVNIPESVEVIGEGAFDGCRNLKTVNGGNGLKRIKDRAFQDCPLSTVVIPATVEEIGLAAYDFLGGTDTVVFQGTKLPVLTVGEGAKRLSCKKGRTYALGSIKTAIVSDEVTDLEGTVLEEGSYGFNGMIYQEAGGLLADHSAGVERKAESGVQLRMNSKILSDKAENSMATLPGNDGSYLLKITDSETASEQIAAAYREIYGGREPEGLLGFDMTLFEEAGQIPITKLGKQYITVQLPKPKNSKKEGLHVVTLDADGQLEAVNYQILSLEDGDYIQFNTNHFSPFGIYSYSSISGQGAVKNGSAFISLSGEKDNTPNTGDPIHPKWVFAMGLLAAAVALFFYKGKKTERF